MDLTWMAWTVPTAIFFAVIFICVVWLTAWEILRPCVKRRGFLPMATTRGDRYFLVLVGSALIHIVCFSIGLVKTPIVLGACAVYAAAISFFG